MMERRCLGEPADSLLGAEGGSEGPGKGSKGPVAGSTSCRGREQNLFFNNNTTF